MNSRHAIRSTGVTVKKSRPQAVTNLDGTWEFAQRFCCGDTVTTNREGTVTTKTYDVLNRLLTTTASGIIHSNTYDAAGNVLKVERLGTNGSVIVLQRHAYDTAGHLTATTNALGEVTLFAEAHGAAGVTNTTTRRTNSSSGPARIEARYLDGERRSLSGSLTHPVRYEYGPTNGGTFTKEIKLNANGSDTSEWTIQFHDTAGRPYKTLYADGAFSQTFYNSKGQPTNEIDPDGVSKITIYDPRGQPAFSVTDMNRDGVIDWVGTDRITWTTNYVVNNGSANVQRSETRVWQTNGVNMPTLLSVQDSAVNGLVNWSVAFGLTNRSETAFSGGGVRYARNYEPNGTFTTTRFENGRAIASARTNSSTQLSGTTFGYDEHGRQKFITDARNGTMTNTYDSLDRVLSRATPTPDGTHDSQRTGYRFDALGQVTAVTNSDSTVTYFTSQPSGERTKTWGAREYPVEDTFDPQGRMKTMKTWTLFAANYGSATTTWNYDSQRGWLSSKRYAGNTGPDYSYTDAGRLKTRTWARGDITGYTNNAAGEVERITYSDATGNVTNTFDRRGRVTTVNSGTNVTSRLYSEAGLLLSETMNGLVVSNRFDELLRRTNVAVVVNGSVVASTGYGFDLASRLAMVTDGTNSATYSYVANSPRIAQLLFKQNSTTRMTTSKSYDFLNRLLSIGNVLAGGTSAESPHFMSALNSANQRTAITNADGSRWNYGYDSLGQVTNGVKFWSDGMAVLGQQFGYLFDDIGNRKVAVSGGDAFGLNKRTQVYTANSLNQYTSRVVPGYLDILGTATNTATVTVNGVPTSRKSDYYRAEIHTENGASAAWQPITNTAVLASGTNDYVTNWTGNAFVPQTPERFTFDLDGNQTSDGRWTNSWDAENELISMTSRNSTPSNSWLDLRFAYDAQHRRTSKVLSNWTGSAWAKAYEQRFVYDGWNLLAICDSSSAVQLSFHWGTDLSGTMQGAGGVGGLISMTVHTGALAGVYFYAFDGNGNVAALISAADGTVVARYEYDPFHRLLRATGPLAFVNPFVAATKFCDWETGLLCYGYRYYDPVPGRWVNKDPFREVGFEKIQNSLTWKEQFLNLYASLENDLINAKDFLGLFKLEDAKCATEWAANVPPAGPMFCAESAIASLSESLCAGQN